MNLVVSVSIISGRRFAAVHLIGNLQTKSLLMMVNREYFGHDLEIASLC